MREKPLPFACVFRPRSDVAGPLGPYPNVTAPIDRLVFVLLAGAAYVYLLQRTYPPGS